ncbi:dethiobiotin synthase [Immundisolibacter sp.]|uniref:dethiobiotin synthase n=1 Tax=Immundisolibacter sp. TaxID=1934948 RepID=UPI002B0E52D2|nr:dethiobiotin synthase [Immundisolibacter sp.]MEA3219469.1 ATP-dependent dethiobiotin synthetase BioD 1 [Immundisolibacter sp.]
MSRGFFVTGTDTGVGKTRVSAGLIAVLRQQGLRVAGMKPVASGCAATPAGLRNDDALALIGASGGDWPYEWVNPYAFAPPIAPHLAAADVGSTIRFAVIEQAFGQLAAQSDCVVVEGVGGWRVPLGPDGDVADLAMGLQLPVVLVVGLRLGCLNHAALTAADIRRCGLPLAGWVGNAIETGFERLDDNLKALGDSLAAPCLGVVRHAAAVTPASVARDLRAPPIGS